VQETGRLADRVFQALADGEEQLLLSSFSGAEEAGGLPALLREPVLLQLARARTRNQASAERLQTDYLSVVSRIHMESSVVALDEMASDSDGHS